MPSRPVYALAVTFGMALASFGFLTLVIVGLAAGSSVAGLAGGLLAAAILATAWLFGVRWAWRRLPRPGNPRM